MLFSLEIAALTPVTKLRGHLAEGQFLLAQEEAQRLLKINPENAFALATLSQCESSFLNFKDAEQYAIRAVSIDPTLADGHLAWGIALAGGVVEDRSLQGVFKIPIILRELRLAVQQDPNLEYGWFTLGITLSRLPSLMGGSISEASKCAQQLKRLNPSLGWSMEGMLFSFQGNWPKAEMAFNEGLKTNKSHPLLIKSYLEGIRDSAVEKSLGDQHRERMKALALFWSDQKINDARVLEAISEALLEAGEAESAWRVALEGTQSIKESSLLNLQLAKIAARSGLHLEEALAISEEAALFPVEGGSGGKVGLVWRQGQILKRLNRIPEAKERFNAVLKINPNHKGAREDLDRLKN